MPALPSRFGGRTGAFPFKEYTTRVGADYPPELVSDNAAWRRAWSLLEKDVQLLADRDLRSFDLQLSHAPPKSTKRGSGVFARCGRGGYPIAK